MANSVPDMPGILAEPRLAAEFRREVARLLGRDNTNFPGAQPVSFSRQHLTELQKQDYYVCEKSDGLRCLLYCCTDTDKRELHYLVDRRNDYYYVEGLHFPKAEDPSFQEFHDRTLVDGELVIDTYPDGRKELKYLVFDCLVLDGNSLMQRSLDKRLGYFREFVVKPWEKLYQTYPDEKQYLPFIIEFKKMEFSYGIEMMFREKIPNLLHGNDGLIFTCRTTPYHFGTDTHIIKWKPPSENSVDFRLDLEFPQFEAEDDDDVPADRGESYYDYDSQPRCDLSVNMGNNHYRYYGDLYMTSQEWDKMKALNVPLQATIVECVQDSQHRWRFHRFRNDKKEANHISTVESVMDSIRDRVEEADLIKSAMPIKDAWKARNAAPPKPQGR